jgi:hypothetical protein
MVTAPAAARVPGTGTRLPLGRVVPVRSDSSDGLSVTAPDAGAGRAETRPSSAWRGLVPRQPGRPRRALRPNMWSRADTWHFIDSSQWARLRRVPAIWDLERALRRVALRVARLRVAELSAVDGAPHAGTGSIVGIVCRDLGGCPAKQGYDVLRALTAAVSASLPADELRGTRPGAGRGTTTTATTSSVGRAAPSPRSATPWAMPADAGDACQRPGYQADEGEKIYWGRFPSVSRRRVPSPALDSQTDSARREQGRPALDPGQPKSSATSHQMEKARQERDRRV